MPMLILSAYMLSQLDVGTGRGPGITDATTFIIGGQ